MRVSNAFIALSIVLTAAACGGVAPGKSVDPASEALSVNTTLNGLSVTLSSSGPLIQGVDNTYTWTVQNVSAATISNITIASNWADAGGTNPVTKATAPGCGTQSSTPIGVYCGTFTLAPGASVTNWVVIDPQKAGPVHYNAYGLYQEGNGSFVVAEAFDTESAAPGAVDLQISGSASQGQPPVGSDYTYTFKVKNAGPWPTSGGVSFADALPAPLAFVSVATTAGSCVGGQTVSCALGDLAVGAEVTVAVAVQAPSVPQSIVNAASASLSASQGDTNPLNNSASVTVTAK